MRIIGIDPGGSTGLAMYDTKRKEWRREVLGPKAHHQELWHHLIDHVREASDEILVVCESFEYRNLNRPGLVLDSVEYIGVVKFFISAYPRIQLIMRPAGIGKCGQKTFVRRQHLERLGLWISGKDSDGRDWKHAMDATAHVLYTLIHNVPIPDLDYKMELLKKGWQAK